MNEFFAGHLVGLLEMRGQRCWHVSIGGVTAPSFLLVLGDKIPRQRRLQNAMQPEDFRSNRGSVELLIWSSWRFRRHLEVTTSKHELQMSSLDPLMGDQVAEISCEASTLDLRIRFDSGATIDTFSDNTAATSPDTNWEFWAGGKHLIAGPGLCLAAE